MVTMHCDSTLAMPLLAFPLSENAALIRRCKKPVFTEGKGFRFSFPELRQKP